LISSNIISISIIIISSSSSSSSSGVAQVTEKDVL
jgi:hypothetical protein